jgi:hypothetical protein
MTGILSICWKTFEDIKENIKAEGNDFMLNSTPVQGLGLLITFSVTRHLNFEENEVIR